jgi:Holliday junction resolvase
MRIEIKIDDESKSYLLSEAITHLLEFKESVVVDSKLYYYKFINKYGTLTSNDIIVAKFEMEHTFDDNLEPYYFLSIH